VTRRELAWIAGVFVGSLPLLATGLGWGLDVDIAIAGGDRVLRGEWPYRDFWTLYAPGSSAAVAATFAIFGRELIAVHAVAAVVAAAACAAFFALLRTAGLERAPALAASGLFALVVWTPSPSLDSYALPRVLLIVGWERVLRGLRDADPRPLLGAGFAFGAAALFKHDVAAYAAMGSGLAIVLAAGPSRLAALARLAAGCACFVAPALIAVAVLAGVDAWHDLVVFPAREFALVRGEAYPEWLPPLATLGPALGDLRAAHRAATALAEWGQAIVPQALMGLWLAHALVRRGVPAAGWLAVACLPFFWAAAHVQQNTHLFSMGVLCCVLVAEFWRRERRAAFRALSGALLALLVISFLVPAGLRFVRMQLERPGARELGLPGTRGIRLPAREYAVIAPLVRLLRERVQPDEPIHVALGRHDAIVIGDPRFYFLADRPAATRYHELHPGVVDRAAAQLEIIESLEKRGVRAVVVWNFGWPAAKLDAILAERRRALPDIGAPLLDRYLAERFERIARFGEYDVRWRRSAE
jgi:hypothetical protein